MIWQRNQYMGTKEMNFNENCIKFYFDYVYHFEIKDEEMIKHFIEVLDDLTERELAVICYRHGLIDGEPKGLEKTAEHYGVEPSVIRDLDVSVIKKLRHPTRSKYFFENKDKQESSDNENKQIILVYRDYFPEGTIVQDLIEQAEKKETDKK